MHQTLYLSWGLNRCPSYLEAPDSPMNQVVSLIWPTLTIRSMYSFQASFFYRLFLFFLLFSTNKHDKFTTCFKTCWTNSWFFPKRFKKGSLSKRLKMVQNGAKSRPYNFWRLLHCKTCYQTSGKTLFKQCCYWSRYFWKYCWILWSKVNSIEVNCGQQCVQWISAAVEKLWKFLLCY